MNLDPIIKNVLGIFNYGPALRPRRDWFALLGIAAVLVVVSALMNVLMFLKVERGESLSAAAPAPAAADTNAPSLDAVQGIFAARAATAAAYQSDPHLADPSQ